MRILYTLNSGQPGGMEYHTLDLAKGMVQKGHDVYVWCIDGPIADMFEEAGAKVTRIEVLVKFGVDIDPIYIYKLVKFLKSNKIEVLHTHELRAVGNSLLAGFVAGIKVKISHIHTPFSQWPIPCWRKSLYTFCYKIAVTLFSTKEIALTDAGKQVKISEGMPENKLVVLPNSFQDQKFDPANKDKKKDREEMAKKYGFPADKFIFGNTSRLSENKGTEVIINAFKFFDDDENFRNRAHLLIAGHGNQEEKLKVLVTQLGLDRKVTFTGKFEDADHTKLYNSLDALVFHSYGEGFGLVIIEAMALKIPVICADLDVLQEVGQGYVFDYFVTGNAGDMTRSMRKVYSEYKSALNLVVGARDFVVANYSEKSFVQNYEDLYLSLLKTRCEY